MAARSAGAAGAVAGSGASVSGARFTLGSGSVTAVSPAGKREGTALLLPSLEQKGPEMAVA